MSTVVQEIITFAICFAAFFSVGRRVWSQIAAIVRPTSSYNADSEASACSGCDSCGLRKKSQIITLDSVQTVHKQI